MVKTFTVVHKMPRYLLIYIKISFVKVLNKVDKKHAILKFDLSLYFVSSIMSCEKIFHNKETILFYIG